MSLFLTIPLVAFLAAFTQGLTGFGSALVAMALLPAWLAIREAAPLVALMAGTIEVFMLVRYRQAIQGRAIWRLVLGMAAGIPVGIFALRRVPERLTLTALGVVIVGYALYALISPRLPALAGRGWAFAFGWLAGVLGGAYNTSGPPVVIYGNCRRWSPAEFKANLQGLFLVGDLLVILGHALGGNLTALVFRDYLIALPAVLLGVILSARIDRRVKPETFRRLVSGLLFLLGLRLML
jgi:hypothetical protein